MKWINELNLTVKEREKLKNTIEKTKIIDINFFQSTVYLFLGNSKVVLLKNSTEKFYKELKINIENDFSLAKSRKKVEKRKACEWTEEEVKYLKDNFYKMDIELLSSDLNKSQYQISLKATEEKLVVARRWSANELTYLEKNITTPNYQLAKTLKRSISSIKAKKRVLEKEKGVAGYVFVKKIYK